MLIASLSGTIISIVSNALPRLEQWFDIKSTWGAPVQKADVIRSWKEEDLVEIKEKHDAVVSVISQLVPGASSAYGMLAHGRKSSATVEDGTDNKAGQVLTSVDSEKSTQLQSIEMDDIQLVVNRLASKSVALTTHGDVAGTKQHFEQLLQTVTQTQEDQSAKIGQQQVVQQRQEEQIQRLVIANQHLQQKLETLLRIPQIDSVAASRAAPVIRAATHELSEEFEPPPLNTSSASVELNAVSMQHPITDRSESAVVSQPTQDKLAMPPGSARRADRIAGAKSSPALRRAQTTIGAILVDSASAWTAHATSDQGGRARDDSTANRVVHAQNEIAAKPVASKTFVRSVPPPPPLARKSTIPASAAVAHARVVPNEDIDLRRLDKA